ncbi:metal-dependent hydrolase [Ruficoccus amylovorans]|uniref:Metal-dependent hydrolase n=1 Tax=Ruficoccus amylovorans TaxID=1804625 RepID=A0A842HIJ8_9BACT|nr:metal-dependent hydrolase [Ruficoccus amylovorans]MBC2595818.1 metal-dependent hydrolase [Ruficoccus amylovorans]
MDSLTQIVLASSLTAAIAPARNRRSALLAGALLGTLPDLDSIPLLLTTDNPVTLMTSHRGFTHSLFILPLLGWLIWWLCKLRGHRIKAAPTRWFWAIQAALLTHPLIDACTVYGTQLLWPFTPPPIMWASLFIIDPLYTIWLLLGCVVALIAGARPIAQKALIAGLVLSSAYLVWAFAAKAQADHNAREELARLGYADAPYFSVPTPLNTLLWRSVALTEDGFLEAERSLLADEGPTRFRRYSSDTAALDTVQDFPNVQRLLWFSNGFIKAHILDHAPDGGQWLVLSDLRMGAEPSYAFNFAVAERDGPDSPWKEIQPRMLPREARGDRWSLSLIWDRIRHSPASSATFAQ